MTARIESGYATNSRMIEIDSDKLRNEFKKRNISLVDASVQIGAQRNHLSHVLNYGRINPIVAESIKMKFNINIEDYIKRDEPQHKEPETKVVQRESFDENKLYQIIYSAVYQAVKTAWMDE